MGLVGGLFLASNFDDCDEDPAVVCDVLDPFTDIGKKVILFGFPVLGAATGALIGTLVETGNWVPAFVPDAATGAATLRWSVPVAF